MGACLTVDEAAARSRAIDRQNKRDFNSERRVVKLLLLGTGGSGKSTVVKQIRLLHGQCSSEDRRLYIETCRSNALSSMAATLTACQAGDYQLPPSLQGQQERVLRAASGGVGLYSPALARDIEELWEDLTVRSIALRGNHSQLSDSTPYFLWNARRLADPHYLPTDQDILRARSITTGIVVVPFKTKELRFELFDVGGQRSERKKWIQCFDNVTSVLFVISLSDFNQVLLEDNLTNRMRESEKLFGEILNSIFFRETPFIVFFNKLDLFKEKLKYANLSDFLPEYPGSQDPREAMTFLKEKYMRMNRNKNRSIFSFETTAVDTSLVRNIFNAITEIILNKILSDAGFE